MKKEVWKDVQGYEGYYQISNLGRIESLDRYVDGSHGGKIFLHGKIKKVRIDKDGCCRVHLSKDGKNKVYIFARLVYKTFNPEFNYDDSSLRIYHKNEDQNDNNIENLYVISAKEIPKTFSNFFYIKPENNPVPVICITTNKRFNSISEAEIYYGMKKYSGSISRCCQGKSKSAGKIILDDGTVCRLVWKYIEDSK